jgi:hypothetical protein
MVFTQFATSQAAQTAAYTLTQFATSQAAQTAAYTLTALVLNAREVTQFP